MAGLYGADIVQLRALAAHFDRAADQLDAHRAGVAAAIRSSAWQGPDAGAFRYQWDSAHGVRMSAAAEALRTNAQRLRANADDQERTSAVDGSASSGGIKRIDPGMVPGSVSGPSGEPGDSERWRESLEWIERFKDNEISGTGWTFGDVAGLVPLLGTSSDVLGGLEKLSNGQVPWHEACDIVGGALKGSGNPIGYGIGLNLALWSDVAEQATEVDWSPKGMQDAFNGMFTPDAWKEVGRDLATKLPAMLAGDFAWW